MHTKVKIISHDKRPDGSEYGEFWQEPIVHLKGCTHPEIGIENQKRQMKYSTEDFIIMANNSHFRGDYDYSKVIYSGSQVKVCIRCLKRDSKGNEHGDFWICPDMFLRGEGCPKCGHHESYSEDEIIDYIKSLGFSGVIEKRNKSILDNKEIDIYIPSLRLGIEFNRLRWHSEKFNKDKYYHLNKTLLAKDKGVSLIQIFEDEYLQHKDIVFSKIRHLIGFDKNLPKVDGRKVVISVETNKTSDVKNFLEKYHIQGFTKYTYAYVARFNDEIVGIMTFLKTSVGEFELNRFCTNYNYRCPGLASRLFSHFIKDVKPIKVKSFLDRRWCVDEGENLYTKLHFKLEAITKPDYQYTKGSGIRYHKFGFRKKILSKKYGFPLSMTESEMVEKLGFYKIWNCGLLRYVWEP